VTSEAHAALRSTGREPRGTIDFYRTSRAMAVHVNVNGLKPGMHALHVHTAACGGSESAADQTLDSEPHTLRATHRFPDDLGMVLADRDGNANQWLRTDALEIEGARGIVGKSVVLHARSSEPKSQPSGGLGEVVACGAIADAGAPTPG
jgi:Cu-Zn family superoxide dismutase